MEQRRAARLERQKRSATRSEERKVRIGKSRLSISDLPGENTTFPSYKSKSLTDVAEEGQGKTKVKEPGIDDTGRHKRLSLRESRALVASQLAVALYPGGSEEYVTRMASEMFQHSPTDILATAGEAVLSAEEADEEDDESNFVPSPDSVEEISEAGEGEAESEIEEYEKTLSKVEEDRGSTFISPKARAVVASEVIGRAFEAMDDDTLLEAASGVALELSDETISEIATLIEAAEETTEEIVEQTVEEAAEEVVEEAPEEILEDTSGETLEDAIPEAGEADMEIIELELPLDTGVEEEGVGEELEEEFLEETEEDLGLAEALAAEAAESGVNEFTVDSLSDEERQEVDEILASEEVPVLFDTIDAASSQDVIKQVAKAAKAEKTTSVLDLPAGKTASKKISDMELWATE